MERQLLASLSLLVIVRAAFHGNGTRFVPYVASSNTTESTSIKNRHRLKYLNGYRDATSALDTTTLPAEINGEEVTFNTTTIPTISMSTGSSSVWHNVTTTASDTSSTTESKVTSAPFVSKNNLHYNDTSMQFVSQLRSMLDEYGGLFTSEFTEAVNSGADHSFAFSHLFDYKSGFDSAEKAGETFLYAGEASSRTPENCYIIKLKNDAQHKTVEDIKSVLGTINGKVRGTFEEAMKGLVACFEPDALPLYILRSISWIDIVERDQKFGACQRQTNAPWGLARISKSTKSKFSSNFDFDLTGKGVNVYVIDSGVWESHPEFGKRARVGYSSFGGSLGLDCSGHGTEVAAVIGGVNVGVAKQANIVAVQVLDCKRQGQNSDLVTALEWIIKNGNTPAIINLSVGGPSSPSLDEAVSNAVARGFTVVVAAGNSGTDACLMSPSSASGAIVVGAINEEDSRAAFSNYGKCVTLFAPGTNILTASIIEKKKRHSKLDGYDIVSGTSLAAPFASGVIAMLLQKEPKLTPIEIKNKLISMSAKNVLDGQGLMSSPNLLLQAPSASRKGKLVTLFSPGSVNLSKARKEGPWSIEKPITIASVIIGTLIIISLVLAIARRRLFKRQASSRIPSSETSK